jgi:hypothetical protein
MTRRLVLLSLATCGWLGATWAGAQIPSHQEAPRSDVAPAARRAEFMVRKLQHAQGLLGALDRAAHDGDLGSAPLESVQLTGQCFSCHESLRPRVTKPRRER